MLCSALLAIPLTEDRSDLSVWIWIRDLFGIKKRIETSHTSTMASKDEELPPSKLGTKAHWDEVYE